MSLILDGADAGSHGARTRASSSPAASASASFFTRIAVSIGAAHFALAIALASARTHAFTPQSRTPASAAAFARGYASDHASDHECTCPKSMPPCKGPILGYFGGHPVFWSYICCPADQTHHFRMFESGPSREAAMLNWRSRPLASMTYRPGHLCTPIA